MKIKITKIVTKIIVKISKIKPKKYVESNTFSPGGIKPSTKDERDYKMTGVNKKEVLPIKYQILKLPPMRNQGVLNSCASFAMVATYEIQLMNEKPRKYLEGAELYHYYNARKFVNKTFPKDKGMTIRDACKAMQKYDMAIEYSYPYKIKKVNKKPKSVIYSIAKLYKIKDYEKLYNIKEIRKSITQNVPVICGIHLKESFMKVNKKGMYKPIGKQIGGHAVVIIGYDENNEMFKFRNSWGRKWGEKGYFKMKYEPFMKESFDWFRVLIK